MNLGNRIRKLRKEQQLTQQELARKIGVTKATISQYEKGSIKNVRKDRFIKLAKVLQTSPQYLLGLTSVASLSQKQNYSQSCDKPEVDLASNDFNYVYHGRKVTEEEMKYVRRILKNVN